MKLSQLNHCSNNDCPSDATDWSVATDGKTLKFKTSTLKGFDLNFVETELWDEYTEEAIGISSKDIIDCHCIVLTTVDDDGDTGEDYKLFFLLQVS